MRAARAARVSARVVDRASSTTSRTLGRGRAGERAGREVVTRAVTPSPSPSSLGEPSASNAATYDGTVVFHVYDSLEAYALVNTTVDVGPVVVDASVSSSVLSQIRSKQDEGDVGYSTQLASSLADASSPSESSSASSGGSGRCLAEDTTSFEVG